MWVKLLLLFFVFSFLFRTDHSFDQDLGRHLKLGEIIWQTKQVPKTNLFSYTNPDFPFINTHWLFEVWVYLTSQTMGLQILLLIKIIIFLISSFLILKIIPKNNQALLLPIGFIFFHVLRERLEFRPEIFSFLFTALTLYILEKKGRLIYLLPIIQFLWINTHIYFFVGLVLQAIFLIQSRKLKALGTVFLLSVVVSLINPNGLNGLLYPFNVNQNYGYTIVENQTMFLLENINFRNPNFLFVKISLAIVALSLITAFVRRKFAVKNILLTLFGTTLALMNVRSFPYLVFISLPAVLENFGSVKWGRLLLWISVPMLLLESFFYLNGDYYKYTNSVSEPKLEFEASGQKALDFAIENNLPQPTFNNFDIGSYLIYRGLKVFVDGRPEGYPKEFFQTVYIPMQSDPQKFAEIARQYGFKSIIFSHTDQTPWGKSFLQAIVKNPDWKTVYLDDFMIILALQGVPLQHVDLSKLDPNSYSFDSYLSYLRLSLFLAQTGNLPSAQKFAQKGLSLFPQSPLGNAMFGIETKNKFFW